MKLSVSETMPDSLTHEPADDHALLVAFLRGRDVECSVCRYNLRNATAQKCPECGVPIRLVVSSPRRLGWWIVCFFASAATCGFTAIMAGAMTVRVVYRGRSLAYEQKALLMVGGVAVLSTATSVVIVRLLRRWPAYSPWARRLTAIGSVIFHLAAVVLLFAVLD